VDIGEGLFGKCEKTKVALFWTLIWKPVSCVENDIIHTRHSARQRRRGRPRLSWIDNVKAWTRLALEEAIRKAHDRDKRRRFVFDAANSRIEDGWKKKNEKKTIKT